MTNAEILTVKESRTLAAQAAGQIGNHSLRATGITDHLKSDGSLAEARKVANHADTRITQLYDQRGDTASLGEYEKVGI
jgi:integrase